MLRHATLASALHWGAKQHLSGATEKAMCCGRLQAVLRDRSNYQTVHDVKGRLAFRYKRNATH